MTGPHHRRKRLLLAVGLIVGGVAAMLLTTLVLRPAFGGRATYYWSYWSLGPDVSQAARHALRDPLAVGRLAVTPAEKVSTVAWLGGVLLYLPLLSPVTLAALPLLAERMLASSAPSWWGTAYQYNAFIEMVLVDAAVDGGVRVSAWLARARARARARGRRLADNSKKRHAGSPVVVAAALGVAAVAVVPRFALVSLVTPGFYRGTSLTADQTAADAHVPDGVTVDAPQMLGPQLSGRDTVLLWGPAAVSASAA